jgi:hypothetical protein|tara:strand:+ start:8250 stop:8441 length:192 start_codon:yes stop_codon:yes gene_type:complete
MSQNKSTHDAAHQTPGRVYMRDFAQTMRDEEADDVYGGQTVNACADAGGVDTLTADVQEGCDF